MRKKLLSIFIIVLTVALAAFCFTACHKDDVRLDVPMGLSVSNKGIVRWYEVDGAESYELRINNEIVPCAENSYNLAATEGFSIGKQYALRVRSVKGEIQSEWSELFAYTPSLIGMTAPILSVKDGKLSWMLNGNATKIIVTVNGLQTELNAKTQQYDLSGLERENTIDVQFIGDGLTIADSGIASIVYDADSGKISLTAPKNVHMEGYELTFDPVYGANIYYLQDVTGKITTLTDNRSDRTNLYLVKAVWAGDTRGNYADSKPAEVTCFAEGKGTEDDPFMISTSEELRFVEFYESINQSKYYKFKNDIALPVYAPAEEEEYNNFYNMGAFSGVIDGDGHKLSNSVVYFRDGYSSLFDSITPSGVIKNLVIDNANYRTWTSLTNDGIMHEKGGECAVLAYTNRGTLDNITVIDSYIYAARDGAAALVSINKGTISNSIIESSTYIYGANEAGGIAIFNSGTISGCINRADVSGDTTVGGIVGRNNGVVTQCGNEGKISATTYGGGIVGYNYNLYDDGLQFKSTISQCYNYGSVSVVSYGGGIAGKNGGDGINEVGKLSYANAGIFSCYNTGAISGASSIGGIVGDNYAFHENEKDLGVINCYNRGGITVNTALLRSTRVYLSIEECPWATNDDADIYMYYWGTASGPSYPGVRMAAVEIDGATYFYVDMSMAAEQLTGVIFTRRNPETGEEMNKTEDITGNSSSGNLLFRINNSWTTATKWSSKKLIDSTPVAAGGVAGYSNMINDCYYLEGTVGGDELGAGVAQGDQHNKIFIGGEEAQSSDCRISASGLGAFAAKLNAYADVWSDSADGPILKWQKGE